MNIANVLKSLAEAIMHLEDAEHDYRVDQAEQHTRELEERTDQAEARAALIEHRRPNYERRKDGRRGDGRRGASK